MKWFAPLLAAGLAVGLFAGCAGSSARLVGSARPALSPAQVRIYRVAPPRYQEIAVLDATSNARFFHGSAEGETDAIERLKAEAARVGANGIILTQVGDRPSGTLGVGVGGGGISAGRRSVVAGGGSASGAAPIVRNGAAGIAIYVADSR